MNSIRQIILLISILAVGNISFAQSFSITPADTVSKRSMRENYESLLINQQNTSTDTISIIWKKVSVTMPALWDATICDNRVCYSSLIDSGMMKGIAPGATAYLLVHVTSHVNYGTAVVRYAVWNPLLPAIRDTLTFIVTVDPNTGINQLRLFPAFCISPNPVENNLHLETNLSSGFTYLITDITGREILVGNASSNSTLISTEGLAEGCYSISIFDQSNIITSKTFIKK